MNPESVEQPDSTAQFYRNLSGFNDFKEVNDSTHYSPVPEDWYVIISDVKGSTMAIENGRYKDVNTLGAASISVLQKSLGTFHFPFVFGGDGATALVHKKDLEKAKKALLDLKSFAKKTFSFELRVGCISVEEVYQAGHKIEVAKFFMNPQKSIAMIKGGGVSWADKKIKDESEIYCLESKSDDMNDLHGLSCRWKPVPTERGQVVSILVQPKDSQDDATLKEIIYGIDKIFEGHMERSCPITENNMRYKSFFRAIKDEWQYTDNHLSKDFGARILSLIICVIAFKFNLPLFFDVQSYFKQLFDHSDYRKFDDVLRMILDCTPEEVAKIEDLLQNYYNQGKVYFGVHASTHSLMTCLVENTQQGGHIHFIDGGNGGYAMAAKAMKIQIKSDRSSPFKQAN